MDAKALSMLSTEDLLAMKSGDLSKVSTEGLTLLRGAAAPKRNIAAEIANDPISRGAREAIAQAKDQTNFMGRAVSPETLAGNPVTRFALGAADPILGGLQLLGNLGEKQGAIENDSAKQLQSLVNKGRGEAYDSKGFDAYRLAGNVLSPVGLAAAKAVTPATSVMGRVAQGAGFGAGAGALTPVTEGEFWPEKAQQVRIGAAIGGAIPGVLEGATAVGRGARHGYRGLVEPFFDKTRKMAEGREMETVAGDRVQDIIGALRNPSAPVRGYKPTAAELVARLPTDVNRSGQAEFAGLQANTAKYVPSVESAVEQGQNKALVDAIRGFGGDKQALEAAVAQRGGKAAYNYGVAGKEQIKPDKIFDELLSRPSMDKVVSRAADLAKEKGVSFTIGKDIPEQKVIGKIVSERGVPLTETIIPAQSAKYPVDSLHYMKMAMDDLLKNPERFGIGAAEAKAIGDTQKEFVKWIGNKSNLYNKARESFKADSVPVNQMQIGQALEQKLQGVLQGDAALRPGVFAGALHDSAKLPQKLGAPRYQTLEDALLPQNFQTTQDVAGVLANKASADSLGRMGAGKASQMTGTPEVQIPPTLSRTGMIVRYLTRLAQGKGTSKMDEEIGKMLLADPQEAAVLMESALGRKAMTDKTLKALRQGVLSATPGMAGGILSQEQQ